MAAKILNFTMRRGDTPVVEAELLDENRQRVNDPAAQYTLMARVTRGASGAPLFSVGPVAQFEAGVGRLPIPTGATSSFTYDRKIYYDVQVVEGNGNVNTLLTGVITVLVDAAHA